MSDRRGWGRRLARRPDADHVELSPSTPTDVWRLLTALLPRDHELTRW